MNIWDLLIPKTMENQRGLARQRFQAGLTQPEMFQTENMPIPQMVQNYEKGYGMPWPQQQAPSPTAPIEGMTTDPNRGTTIQGPENMPIEYIEPRSLEQSAMRQSGIKGRSGMEQTVSGLEYAGQQMPRMEGFFEDAGEDIGDYDIPASIGGFQRPQPTEPGKSYGDPYFDPQTQSLLQEEAETGEVSKIAGAPAGGSGSGEDREADEYKRALDTYKALNERLDPFTALLIERLGVGALKDPGVQARIKGKLSPDEQRALEMSLQYMEWYNTRRQQQYKLGPVTSDREASTADEFLRSKGLR
jgi:hypothetical protein